jgi:AAA+ superfamily predicted ATPase
MSESNHQLMAALARLDALLALAVRQLNAAGGPEQTPDFFRGLQIRASDIERILSGAPGAPLFRAAKEQPGSVSLAAGVPRLEQLCGMFGLTAFDLNAVMIALAPEIDLRYERLYAYLQDDITRKRPMVDLALNLFAPDVESRLALRTRFGAEAPLVKHGLIHLIPDSGQADPPLLSHYLKLEDLVVSFVLGEDALDRRLSPFCRLLEPPDPQDEASLDDDRLNRLPVMVAEACAAGRPLRLYLQGAAVEGKRRAAQVAAQAAGSGLLRVDLELAPEGGAVFGQAVSLAFRAARLMNAVPYFVGLDGLRRDGSSSYRALLDAMKEAPGITILSGTLPWIPPADGPAGVFSLRLDVLDRKLSRECWRREMARLGIAAAEPDLVLLADRFRLTADQISDAAACAANEGRWRGAEATLDDFCAAARAECGHELTRLARKVTPKYAFEDIVLPPDQMEQLREICEQAEYREKVFGEWGFGRKLSLGKGLNVLFSGPPGTGKTMAAEVIASQLKLDLYKIDLSQIVSKYIGETEKNLDRVFTAAEHSNAILFFDEADALFGKRSEVKDSHDRYANIEIGYLLQKMEEYEGIAILATNVKQHIDEAFVRRIQMIVEFPFPNEEERGRVWRVIFPAEAPINGDVDFSALARAVRLASGNVRSIARASAFYAAADGGIIRMAHVVKASRREYQKLGRAWTEGEWNGRGAAV